MQEEDRNAPDYSYLNRPGYNRRQYYPAAYGAPYLNSPGFNRPNGSRVNETVNEWIAPVSSLRSRPTARNTIPSLEYTAWTAAHRVGGEHERWRLRNDPAWRRHVENQGYRHDNFLAHRHFYDGVRAEITGHFNARERARRSDVNDQLGPRRSVRSQFEERMNNVGPDFLHNYYQRAAASMPLAQMRRQRSRKRLRQYRAKFGGYPPDEFKKRRRDEA